MDLVKQVFAKIISGFFIGVGFFIAAALLGGYAVTHMVSTEDETRELDSGTSTVLTYESPYREYSEDAGLEVYVTKEKIGDGAFVLLGKLENAGEDTWQMISLQADLFDKNGQFIEQCTEYVSQILRPGDKVNFKVSCRSQKCNTVDVDGYDSYKLKVASAHFVQMGE